MTSPDPVTNRRLNIVLISQYFHPEPFSNSVIALDLHRRGHLVRVVTGVPNYGRPAFFEGYSNRHRRHEDWGGIKVYRARSVARKTGKARLIANYLTFPLTATWTVLTKLRSHKPDVIFVSIPSPPFQILPGIVLKWLHGVPMVVWVQDLWPDTAVHVLNLRSGLGLGLLNFVCRWLHRRADLLLAQSPAMVPLLQEQGISLGRIRVLPNTAPETFRPMNPEEAPLEGALLPSDAFRIVFTGNLGESQALDIVIDAAEKLKHHDRIRWILIGSGRDEARLRERVEALGLSDRVVFLGRHPEERMPKFIAHAQALLVSLRDTPVFQLTVPYKLQGYMACGKPILAALAGEGARIVREARCGLVVPPEDSASLALAVEELMATDEQARRDMGAAARAWFLEHYSAERVFANLETWLIEAADSGRAHR